MLHYYENAFDKVKHSEHTEILEQTDIDGEDLKLKRNSYRPQEASVKIEGDLTLRRNIEIGVPQGCILSLRYNNPRCADDAALNEEV